MEQATFSLNQPFTDGEESFVLLAKNWIEESISENKQVLTHFLNPRERQIIKMLLASHKGWNSFENGGFQGAESMRVIIAPKALEPDFDDFELSLCQVEYDQRFNQLKHRTILGAIVNSGLKREMVGDIVTDGQNWQIVTTQYIARILETQITQIGHINVKLLITDFSQLIEPIDDFQESSGLFSSLRLDTFISSVYNVSRSDSVDLISHGRVKVNFVLTKKATSSLSVGDLLSVRGYGRVRITENLGETGSGKLKISYLKLRR